MAGTWEPVKDIDDLSAVIKLLKPMVSSWHNLGIQLKIKKDTLNRIEADHKHDGVQRCLSEMVHYWQRNDDKPSWEKLTDAVNDVGGHTDVVKSIHRQCLCSSSSEPESGYAGSPESGSDSDKDVFTTSSFSPGCGCGKCNIHKMCTEGCPKPDHTKRLPILIKHTGGETASELASERLATPNSTGHQNSVDSFETETLDLRTHFGSLVYKSSKSLKKREEKNDVALYLLNSFPMLRRIADKINQATDMATLFAVVTCQACSWFNFDIIKKLIEEFGSDEDRTSLVAYERHFESFAKRRLPKEMTHVELGSKAGVTGCKKLVIKVDQEWESITIGELERLCKEFAKTLGADRKNVYLADVTEGCIMLTLMISEEIANSLSISRLTSAQKRMLASEKVVRLTCGKMKWSITSLPQQPSSDSEEDEKVKVSNDDLEATIYPSNTSLNASYLQHQTAMSFSPSIGYVVRSFLYRLSKKLSTKESNALVSIHDLPARLRYESPFDVLMQLEMQSRYSTLEELASILKDINRDDLAKEVTTFAKKNKKKLTQAEYTQPHRSAYANLECVIQVTKLQCAILMDQTHILREAANDAGHKRIEEIVRNDLKSASEQMNKKLEFISRLPAEIQTKKRLSSSSSTSSESSSLEGSLEGDSGDNTYATIRLCDVKSIMVTSQSPTSREQQVPALSKLSPLPKAQARVDSGEILPAPSVRSRDDVKPKQLEVPAAVADDDDDYSEMTSTSTGDSGFADSCAFIKEEPRREQIQPPAQQTASYTGLNRHTMEHVGYYKTAHKEIDDIQDVIYDKVTPTESVADGPEYINVPARQRK